MIYLPYMFPICFSFHYKGHDLHFDYCFPSWFESYKLIHLNWLENFVGQFPGNWTIILKGKYIGGFKHLLHVSFDESFFHHFGTLFYLARWPNLTTCFLWVVSTHHFGKDQAPSHPTVRWVTGSWGRGLDCNSWHHRSRFEATKGAEQVWMVWCFGWGGEDTKPRRSHLCWFREDK